MYNSSWGYQGAAKLSLLTPDANLHYPSAYVYTVPQKKPDPYD